MYAVTVTFVVRDQMMESFLPLITENASTSLAREDACYRFDVLHDPDRPNEVFLYELYSDRAAFEVHLASDHFKHFAQISDPMVAGKEVKTFRQVVG